MRKFICTFIFISLSCGAFAKPQMKQQQQKEQVDCNSIHEKLEDEQFKFHDTLSQMMNDLRESSTPDSIIDQGKIKKYLNRLNENKKEMSRITKSSKYGSCFL